MERTDSANNVGLSSACKVHPSAFPAHPPPAVPLAMFVLILLQDLVLVDITLHIVINAIFASSLGLYLCRWQQAEMAMAMRRGCESDTDSDSDSDSDSYSVLSCEP
uniref:HDC19986 n=1 Tax=Drosophila melanogaster TaxID=7227 RepID=Q6II23_DROME|nr:TPA_inf: HDC19986 [Drosophila melanogaster]